jgi:hypothetical protein
LILAQRTEPHYALTVDGEGSGGNEVHEIYVRLEAGLENSRTTTIARWTRTGNVANVEGGEGVTLAAQLYMIQKKRSLQWL